MFRHALIGALIGAVMLGVLIAGAIAIQPTGGLRLLLGAATVLFAPPYFLLGATVPSLLRNHAALYAFAATANAALYSACFGWLFRTRGRHPRVRYGPICAVFVAWTVFVIVHG
jgi:hypothetical protein